MDGQNDRVQHFLWCLLDGVNVVTTVAAVGDLSVGYFLICQLLERDHALRSF